MSNHSPITEEKSMKFKPDIQLAIGIVVGAAYTLLTLFVVLMVMS